MNTPFEYVVWDAETCAAYLMQKKATFLKRTQWLDGFPARLPIEGHPRWNAMAVTRWANGITNESRTEAA